MLSAPFGTLLAMDSAGTCNVVFAPLVLSVKVTVMSAPVGL